MAVATISASDLAGSVPEVLNRVLNKGERFLVQRAGETVASLGPPQVIEPAPLGDVVAQLRDLVLPGSDFADDLECIQSEQPEAEVAAWPS